MKYTFFVLFTIVALGACKSTQNQQPATMNYSVNNPVYKVSAPTRKFITELNKELTSAQVPLAQFVPSDEWAAKHALAKQDGLYYITGMIQSNAENIEQQMTLLGIKLGKPAGNIYTVSVPLNKCNDFFANTAIQYFEISVKATSRK